jgi:hypothetical protein
VNDTIRESAHAFNADGSEVIVQHETHAVGCGIRDVGTRRSAAFAVVMIGLDRAMAQQGTDK